MKRLRSWQILDPRTGETRNYEIAVIRRKDGRLALCKFWEHNGRKVCSTYYAMPGAPADDVFGKARTLLKHLESKGCVVNKPAPKRR